jgi:hypothetical protein
VIHNTLTHRVVLGSEISCCSLSFLGDSQASELYSTYEDGTECFETSTHKIQTPGNRPKERLQHSDHGESLKLRETSACRMSHKT